MSIYAKLAKIQSELICPKGQTNDFGKYNYRSCEDILKAVKPLCDANECVLHITNDLEEKSNRVYVKAIVTLVDLETSETITSIAHAREEEVKKGQDGSQITGSSSSYARKYALAGLFCIDNEKDSDATNDNVKENKKKPAKVEDAETKRLVIAYFKRHNFDDEKIAKICELYGVKSTSELSNEHCLHYIQALQKNGGNINE